MNLKPYDAFIFDLDGTLFTIPVDWTAARQAIAQLAGEELEGKPLFPTLRRVTIARPEVKGLLFANLDVFEVAAVEGSRPINGAMELLDSIVPPARIALVTMQGLKACSAVLGRHGVAGKFSAIFTREYSLDRREQLLRATTALSVSPQASLFVGDRNDDVIAAKGAGIDIALMGRSNAEGVNPSYTFRTLGELKESLSPAA